MPGLDRRGPRGEGPRSGRRAGLCRDREDVTPAVAGGWMGRGRRCGGGWGGGGGGQGLRRRGRAWDLSQDRAPDQIGDAALRARADALRNKLAALEERLDRS